jgi:membrane carboxypeptidase/penicillin-binding protein PbpC
MVNTTGLTGAAPIWSQFMQLAVPYVSGNNPKPFQRPSGIVEKTICALSGTEPSQWCKDGTRTEIFLAEQPPLPASQDLKRQVLIDTWTGLQASDACQNYTEKANVINVTDQWARQWFKSREGRNWLDDHGFSDPPVYAPERQCNSGDPRPNLELSIHDGETINQQTIMLSGTADATGGFRSWFLEVGIGRDPHNWTTIAQGGDPVRNAPFINWDLSNLPNQTITLHLHADGRNGYADRYVHFDLALPPTAAPPTDTPVPTDTPPAPTSPPPTETPGSG